jgi:hypothetical protein
MNELRTRPKNDYLQTANWQELFVLTENWQSEMDFFSDEIKFLKNLISKYFIWITEDSNLSRVQDILPQINRLEQISQNLGASIKNHLSHLESLIENSFTQDEAAFRSEHIQLEEELVQFNKEFRTLKKVVFTITEQVLESEKLYDLFNN